MGAGNIFLDSSGSVKVKNMTGDSEVVAKGNVLIDGADGSLNVKAVGVIDVHLDSSFKKATLQSSSEIRMRTPPDQNEHEFLIKDCDHIEIVGFQNFTNHAVENAENYRKVSLSGENTAGHPRKVAFV